MFSNFSTLGYLLGSTTQGILLTPKTTITERGGTRAVEGKLNMSPVEVLVNLWRHECERVFCDKLTTNKVQPTPKGRQGWVDV